MRRKVLAVLLYSVLAGLVGCKKTNELSPNPQVTASPSTPKFDACALITKEQIEAVQGSPITDTKSSRQSGKGFLVSQCYYATRDSTKSVSLTVTQGDPGSAARGNTKDFWNKTFGRYSGELKERDRDKEKTEAEGAKEEREKSVPPKKIEGVGDDAFCSVARLGGALYVLKKDAFIRISVGGGDNERPISINQKRWPKKPSKACKQRLRMNREEFSQRIAATFARAKKKRLLYIIFS